MSTEQTAMPCDGLSKKPTKKVLNLRVYKEMLPRTCALKALELI